MKLSNSRTNFSAVAIAVSIAFAIPGTASEPTPQHGLDPYYGAGLTIRVVDEKGQPIEGAIAGFEAIRWTDGKWKAVCNVDGTVTNADGLVQLSKGKRLLNDDEHSLVAWHEDKKLIGIIRATQSEPDEQGVVTIPIANACHVTGVLTCDERRSLISIATRSSGICVENFVGSLVT